MNSDDTIRLSKIYGHESLVKLEATRFLYKELLASLGQSASVHRDAIRRLLSASYFSLGRVLYRKRDYVGAAKNLVMAGRYSRAAFIRECADSWARRRLRAKGVASGGLT